jgi:hypothetical protein
LLAVATVAKITLFTDAVAVLTVPEQLLRVGITSGLLDKK